MGCAKSKDWLPTSVTVWYKHTADADILIITMTLPAEVHKLYGAPASVDVTLTFSSASHSAAIEADVRW